MRFLSTFARSLVVFATLVTAAHADTSVWKISKGDQVLYLGGTMHLLAPSDYPLPEEFNQAYEQSQTLVLEANIGPENLPKFQALMQQKLMYQDGNSVASKLEPQTLADLQQHLLSRQVPFNRVSSMKAGFLALNLSLIEYQRLGLTAEGVDQHFLARSKDDGKQQAFLETAEQQVSFMQAMGQGKEDEIIRYTLDDLEELPSTFADIKHAWHSGNMQQMQALTGDEMREASPEVYEVLILNRNNAWMPQLTEMLASEPVEFVLVGALHLAGPQGLLAQLKNHGYVVTQL